jgi:hypothetical protein
MPFPEFGNLCGEPAPTSRSGPSATKDTLVWPQLSEQSSIECPQHVADGLERVLGDEVKSFSNKSGIVLSNPSDTI